MSASSTHSGTQAPLRWGILSTANINRALIPAIRASSNGKLVAVASRDATRAKTYAQTWEIPTSHGSYDALLQDPDIDAVYIPLPNSGHREWTVRAAERRKHVLCEKPLALNAAECREMEAAAAKSGVTLMEAFMYRFHPRIAKVLELIRGGAIGDVRVIRSCFTFRLTKPDNIRWLSELGGGALMDVGCYCVNLSRMIVGREPIQAQAFASWAPTGVDAELAGTLVFPDGVTAQLDCALTMERREIFEVAGTEGVLRVESAFLPGTDPVSIEERRGREPPKLHSVAGADEYQLMVEHFADAAIHRRPVRYPAAEAAANMTAIEALYRSARNGGNVVSL